MNEKQINAMAWRMCHLALDNYLQKPDDELVGDFEKFDLSPKDIADILHRMTEIGTQIYAIYLDESKKVISE